MVYYPIVRFNKTYIFSGIDNTIIRLPSTCGTCPLSCNTCKKLKILEERWKSYPQLEPPTIDELRDAYSKRRKVSVTFNLVKGCIYNCRYCPYGGAQSIKFLQKDTIDKTISFLERNNIVPENIILYAEGEPLLNASAIRYITKYFKENYPHIRILLVTSLVKLTQEMLDFIVSNNIYLQVSLDGPRDVHNKYRMFKDGSGTFDTVYKNLFRIKTYDDNYYRKAVVFHATLAPLTLTEVMRIEEFFKNDPIAKFNNVSVGLAYIDGAGWTWVHSRPYSEMLNDIKHQYINSLLNGEISKIGHGLFFPLLYLIHHRQEVSETTYKQILCVPGLRRLYIDVDGTIYMCTSDKDKNFKLGDIEKGIDYNMLFYKFIDFCRDLFESKCKSCWARNICNRCPALTMNINSREDFCNLYRLLVKYSLEIYTILLENKKLDVIDKLYESFIDIENATSW